MKKINILIFVTLLFSIMVEAALSVVPVHAEAKELQLIDEKFLKLTYECQKLKDSNQWVLKFNRQSEEEDQQQRLKVKVTDETDHIIDYPEPEDMVEKEGWLIEKEFSAKKEGQVAFEVSKSIKQLNLYVQMDQQESGSSEVEKVQEDILDRKEPFILETNKKAAKTSSSKIKSEEESKKETERSDEFIGPKMEVHKNAASQAVATANRLNRMYASLYENKETKYKPEGGTHPEFAWQPIGQTNVINHQGGLSSQAGWDGLESWDVASNDFSKSYIKYGDDVSNSNIQLRKYAQQTDKPDEFKIKLNVRGNTTYKPGVDIVFLMDNSQSMDSTAGLATGEALRKTNANLALKKIVDELKTINEPEAENIRIGAEIFSDYSYYQSWGGGARPGEIRTFKLSKNTADWDKMVKEYTRAVPNGVTFTQRGLQEAKDLFDSSAGSDRHKLLFVLTDGAPNRSWETNDNGTANLDMYPDQRYFTNFIKGTKGNYNAGKTLNSNTEKMTTSIDPPYRNLITSHITTANSTAMDIKNSGIEIHTIALQLMVNYNEQNIPNVREKQIRGLYKMSTKKANATNGPNDDVASDFHFYDVSNGDDLTEYFKSWYETIIRTVDKGVITDPLGDMVELVDGPQWRQVVNDAPRFEDREKPTILVENNRRLIKVNNINLSRNQEIEIEYTVRLKTTDASFVSGLWYPANGETYLEPTPERTTDKLEFGRPSVKYQKADFVIPVEKIWLDKHQETNDYWGMRPNKVTVKLQKANGSDWDDVESIDLIAANGWKGSFSAVEGGSENTYRVIEPNRTIGYMQPRINQASFTSESLDSDGIKVINELLRGDYTFWKFMEDGQTKFDTDRPKFKVTRTDGKVLAEDLEPNDVGKVSLKDLPIGDYTVEETYVPKGFKKMPDLTINVTENNSSLPTNVVIKVGGKTEEHIVRNELKDFSLIVEKVDDKDSRLAGATFKLTGPNYDQTRSGGPDFEFKNLRPGSYTLTETDNPDGYERIQDPITFVISQAGKVTVADHEHATGTGGTGVAENTIQLKVTNKKVRAGVLPQTGDYGIRPFLLVPTLLVFLGMVLSAIHFYYSRRKG